MLGGQEEVVASLPQQYIVHSIEYIVNIQLRTTTYDNTLLRTTAYDCVRLRATTYYYVLLRTITYYYVPLRTTAHHYVQLRVSVSKIIFLNFQRVPTPPSPSPHVR